MVAKSSYDGGVEVMEGAGKRREKIFTSFSLQQKQKLTKDETNKKAGVAGRNSTPVDYFHKILFLLR